MNPCDCVIGSNERGSSCSALSTAISKTGSSAFGLIWWMSSVRRRERNNSLVQAKKFSSSDGCPADRAATIAKTSLGSSSVPSNVRGFSKYLLAFSRF